jgi:hypothetical protein
MSGQIPGMTTQLPRLVGRSAGAKRSDPDFRATEAGHTAAARALGSLYLTGAGWRRTPTRQRGGCGSPANPAITLRGSTSPISCSMAPAVRRIRRGSRIGLNRRRPSAISSPRSISGSASTKASGSSPTRNRRRIGSAAPPRACPRRNTCMGGCWPAGMACRPIRKARAWIARASAAGRREAQVALAGPKTSVLGQAGKNSVRAYLVRVALQQPTFDDRRYAAPRHVRHALILILKGLFLTGSEPRPQRTLPTRGIWVNCTDVKQARRPAPFGVRPALFLFCCQTAARCSVSADRVHRASPHALRCGQPACARAMAAPTWFERASLHAAVISAASCRLPAQGPDPRGSTSCVCRQLLSRSWCAGAYLIVLERRSP